MVTPRQEYLLTLVECAEDEAGEELHVVFYMLIVGRGWGTGRKGERREGRHCRPISEYKGWEMGVHSYGFWLYYIPWLSSKCGKSMLHRAGTAVLILPWNSFRLP
jgi:hypothetical protein